MARPCKGRAFLRVTNIRPFSMAEEKAAYRLLRLAHDRDDRRAVYVTRVALGMSADIVGPLVSRGQARRATRRILALAARHLVFALAPCTNCAPHDRLVMGIKPRDNSHLA